jgi:hypothetical protein
MPVARALPRIQPELPLSEPVGAAAASASSTASDNLSEQLDALLADTRMHSSVSLAWDPKRPSPPQPLPQLQQQGQRATPRVAVTGGVPGGTPGGLEGVGGAPSSAGRPFFASGIPPPTRLFAKAVRERADRKWMWLVPPCKRDNTSALSVWLPTTGGGGGGAMATRAGGGGTAADSPTFPSLPRALRAISFFAMVSPGARLRHTLDGRPLRFAQARGSFLAQSWGYLQQWHVLEQGRRPQEPRSDGAAGRARRRGGGGGVHVSPHEQGNALEWRLCTDYVPNERCVGFRCGLEFKMPMRTAAVGWFLALSA